MKKHFIKLKLHIYFHEIYSDQYTLDNLFQQIMLAFKQNKLYTNKLYSILN